MRISDWSSDVCSSDLEIEFFAQVHQLIYGGRDPSLRVPATVDALAALAAAGRIEPDVATRLSDHYATLRRIEHRLQMIEDQQTHSLPIQDRKSTRLNYSH